MATGCLSAAKVPGIKGLDTFNGRIYHTGHWPHESVDFSGCRVAVVGTEQQTYKATYNKHRSQALATFGGFEIDDNAIDKLALDVTPEEREQTFEKVWQVGDFSVIFAFKDLLFNKEVNDIAAEFVRSKIRSIIKDPTVAENLLPYDHAIGTERLCLETKYYETYNGDNVTLVNPRKENIEEITPVGLKTTNKLYEVDIIVFATGFDAMTGALCNIDIRGRSGYTLKEKWKEGPRTYLGIMTAGFPNLFIITGPGSPPVLSNMIVSIEQHVEWLGECLDYLQKQHFDTIEPTIEAEDGWINHVNEVANITLYPTANFWYTGANIAGKPRVFIPYAGGIPAYHQKCKDIATNGYEGFKCTKHQSTSSVATD